MNINASKGSKPSISKAIIILMSLLYVLSPMRVEVSKLLHSIVHALEMPDVILTHSQKTDTKPIHKSILHKNSIDEHNHEIIDFVDSVLAGATPENESSDLYITSHKIDKHIVIEVDYEQNKATLFMPKNNFIEKEKKLYKGYLSGFKEPPKV